MGNYDAPLDLGAGMSIGAAGRFFIVAREAELAGLRFHTALPGVAESTFVAIAPDGALPDAILRSAHVLVLEVDPASEHSLRRVARVRAERPDLPIIAALNQADISSMRMLIRQGVADVATLPFAPEELASQILDQYAQAAAQATPDALAPMTTVVRSTGGCGATTVVTHLAQAIAEEGGGSVCVVDLDLQSADVAAYLGETPKLNLSALLEAGDRLDHDLLRSAVTETQFGFSLVAAPDAITPLETVDVDQLLKILRLLRSEYDHVLVDLPASWTNWALSAALASTSVVLVTDLSVSSLRQAKRRLQLLSSIGVLQENIKVVVNRAERRLFKTISVGEASEALQCDIVASLAAEGSALRSAQDQGLLLAATVGKSKFGADIRSLAKQLV